MAGGIASAFTYVCLGASRPSNPSTPSTKLQTRGAAQIYSDALDAALQTFRVLSSDPAASWSSTAAPPPSSSAPSSPLPSNWAPTSSNSVRSASSPNTRTNGRTKRRCPNRRTFPNVRKSSPNFVTMPKASSFSPSSLAWALEEEAIGNGVKKELLDSEKFESRGVSYISLDEVGKSDTTSSGGGEQQKGTVIEEEDLKNGREMVSERTAKLDVRALAQNLWEAKTANDVEDVFKNLQELPAPVYSSMIKGFGKDNRLGPAFALIEWLKRKRKDTNGSVGPNLFIYNSLLSAVNQCGQHEEVDKVMEDMAEQGILPNIVTYNTLMSVYLEQGWHNKALSVLVSIEEKGLSPTPVTYSTALLVYQRMVDASGALKFFVELRNKYEKGEIIKGTSEDWENEFVKLKKFMIRICYQVMRQWLVKGDNQTTKVLQLLTDMDKAQLSPGQAECEKLIWACTHECQYIVAKQLYKRIRDMDIGISLSVCNHVIWLMGKAKKWWAALEIYEDLLDKGPKPNNLSYELIVSHFNVLLTAARKRGIWRWGVRLLNKMQDKGLRPGAREWNAVLVACSKASETLAAVQIFGRMVDQGEKPTILSYGALLSALEKSKLYDHALQVWEHMCKMGVKPNLYAYTILASVYIGKGRSEQVDSVVHEMISSGIEPTVVTFNAIISACARNNLGSAAFEWYHRMKVQHVTPNEITYEMLIEALAQDAKPRLAYDLYLRAHNEGLNLSSSAYDAATRSCQVNSASIDLSTLEPRPPEKKKIAKTRKTLSEFCFLADIPRRDKLLDKEEYSSWTQRRQ